MNKKTLPQKVQEHIHKISQISEYLWTREWAERNAGNISIDMTEHFTDTDFTGLKNFTPYDFPKEAAGKTYFITGTGSYLRDLTHTPEKAGCILYVNKEATGYSIIWGGASEGFKPTSEVISHIRIHDMKRKTGSNHTAVLHTHPVELLVLSHHPIFQSQQKFNRYLWQMCPEIRIFVPNGVYCAPFRLPGSEALAALTLEGLRNKDVVIWEKHGSLATGEDVEKAFDYIDVANKGAKLVLQSWFAGFEPSGLTSQQMNDLEQFI